MSKNTLSMARTSALRRSESHPLGRTGRRRRFRSLRSERNDGNDYVSGFTGNDILEAGGGSDYIYAADGEFDRVSGGPGYNVCVVDKGDDVAGCEEVYTE